MTYPLTDYARFMGTLTPDSLPGLRELVAPDVTFHDPFNQVVGADRMEAIFAEMFETMGAVRFEILDHALNDRTGFLHWRLHSQLRGAPWQFSGMSLIEFDATGRVVRHMDHWDAARHFYEHFPVLGWVLRKVRSRIAL